MDYNAIREEMEQMIENVKTQALQEYNEERSQNNTATTKEYEQENNKVSIWPTKKWNSDEEKTKYLALFDKKINSLSQNQVIGYMGFSDCCMCFKENGCMEYYFDNFVIPEGYRHYMNEHSLRMDDRLIQYFDTNKSPTSVQYVGFCNDS